MMPQVLPFFLRSAPGERFCLYYAPDPAQAPRGVVMYVPPFAEELNKTRRMAALQARAFAAAGYGVLQVDLYGCGDSSGDFGEARWDIWKRDLLRACDWLLSRQAGPLHLWGLRLGSLLALDVVSNGEIQPDLLLLWQPVISGRTHLRQFLRTQTAAEMLTGTAVPPANEVGGYAISGELQQTMRELDAYKLRPRCKVLWIEQTSAVPYELAPSSQQLLARWGQAGIPASALAIQGPAFWASTEIEDCPGFLSATAAMLMKSDSDEP